MSKKIDGTDVFSGGDLYRPDGSDNGNEFSSVVTAFMERLGTHNHSGESSILITVPPSVQDEFLVPVFTADGTGRFKTTLDLTDTTTELKNPTFYYKEQADENLQENWHKFYPSYDVDATDARIVTLRKLLSGTISIKVIA